MVSIFTPKHQKLVNQCYPPGRTPDKKPKSSETSYLLYYVNSRRPKLEKVSTYLVKKSASDLNRKRLGNLSVTLELLSRIVEDCSENMTIFIKDFIHIMTLVLNNNNSNNDVSIVSQVENVFSSICKNVDGAIISGDSEFLETFKAFIVLYFKIVNSKLNDTDLILKGCLDLSTISNLGTIHQWSQLVKECVKISLTKFQERHREYSGIRLDPNEGDSSFQVTKRLSRTQTTYKMVGLDDLAQSSDYSILVLNSFFNTNETDKLSLSINALIGHLLNTPNIYLLQFICDGIPVQLRYVVILLCVRPLGSTEEKNALILLKLISSLLTSGVSIIGLSVIDILRKLLNFQVSDGLSNELVHQISTTIKDLNRKTYYKQQSFDMFAELNYKLNEKENAKHKDILSLDLDALISITKNECLNLDLFAEFTPYVSDKAKLKSLLYKDSPHTVIFTRFFKSLTGLADEDLTYILDTAFSIYKESVLLSGLSFYLDQTCPSNSYYAYHLAAARFLALPDYQSQISMKMDSNELFSQEDLLNYYSDLGSNPFSDSGTAVILAKNDEQFGVDTPSETKKDPTPIPLPKIESKDIITSASKHQGNNMIDTHSVRSLKHSRAPKVKDLKNLVSARNSKNPKTLRGSQSVKSKVTNITFLLSELANDRDEIKITDPEEVEIVGMDKQDLARSYSLRINTIENQDEKTRSISPENILDETAEDGFIDAQEEIEVPSSTRGRLFMA